MTFMKSSIVAAAIAVTGAAASAENIVEIAAGDERFSTLVAAVSAAGLADTLSGPGPFTVFAPTNEAFAALPDGTLESLLLPENKGQLTEILTYHVVGAAVPSGDIKLGSTVVDPLLADQTICVIKNPAGVTVADGTGEFATVVAADIAADNGVIHVVDKVLLPGTQPECVNK